MQIEELWVRRDALREMKQVRREAEALEVGEIRVAIDKFGLTANNVSYAVSGEAIGYWKYFPVEGPWGMIPAWGFADVVESRCEAVPVGERIWGFFPIASHVSLRPDKINPMQFVDARPHRRDLPSLYNMYMRTGRDPAALKAMEDERCLLFPLFSTSFILYDYLLAHDFFGAEQVLVGSASSKTGFGLAYLLHHDQASARRVVGLTSAGNLDFVRGLNVCDEVVAYEALAELDPARSSAFVDMAGSGALICAVHRHFGERIVESCIVGATHWEAGREHEDLPGARPRFFFAPKHIARREQDWGPGQVMMRAFAASMKITQGLAGQLEVSHRGGPQAVADALRALLDNAVPPRQGLMLSMQR